MSLESKWEKFRGGPAARLGKALEPRVTINRRGLIYLNGWAYKALGSPKAVAIYYSREDDSIALEPAYPRFSENFLVVKKQMGWAVHASTFCRHYGIRIPATERFLRPELTNEGQLILDLRETVGVGKVNSEQ
ncbi:MAG: hypothetical protein ACKVRN_16670 [Pyrinomonadaceae bacterium]